MKGEDPIEWRVHKQFDRWRDGDLPNETLREAIIMAIRRGRAAERAQARRSPRLAVQGIVRKSHVDPDGTRVIDAVDVTGVSIRKGSGS